jgi:hypothetical protein
MWSEEGGASSEVMASMKLGAEAENQKAGMRPKAKVGECRDAAWRLAQGELSNDEPQRLLSILSYETAT